MVLIIESSFNECKIQVDVIQASFQSVFLESLFSSLAKDDRFMPKT